MVELYYPYPRVLNRLRAGTLGAEMDRIAARFCETGYKPASANVYLAHIAQFDRFLRADSSGGCNTLKTAQAVGVLQMKKRRRIYVSAREPPLLSERR